MLATLFQSQLSCHNPDHVSGKIVTSFYNCIDGLAEAPNLSAQLDGAAKFLQQMQFTRAKKMRQALQNIASGSDTGLNIRWMDNLKAYRLRQGIFQCNLCTILRHRRSVLISLSGTDQGVDEGLGAFLVTGAESLVKRMVLKPE